MGRIIRQYDKGEPHSDEYDTLVPDKIEVLGCRQYQDCSYIETVRFTFVIGNARGATPLPLTQKVIELDIETGYLPEERIVGELKRLLFGFKIFQLEQLVKAFTYRRYYCKI